MREESTTVVVQRHLDALAGDAPAEPIIRELLARAVHRLERQCAQHAAPKLPAFGRASDESGDGRNAWWRGGRVAQGHTFGPSPDRARSSSPWPTSTCAGSSMTWPAAPMNDPAAVELREGLVPAPASSESGITPDGRRMLEAIDNLPQDEREVFGLVRFRG